MPVFVSVKDQKKDLAGCMFVVAQYNNEALSRTGKHFINFCLLISTHFLKGVPIKPRTKPEREKCLLKGPSKET